MNNYEMKKRQVKRGESKVFESWKSVGVSESDFLDGLKWLSEDPEKDFGIAGKRMTRELGCTKEGKLIKLERVHDQLGEFLGFYEIETNRLWTGRVSISCRDSI